MIEGYGQWADTYRRGMWESVLPLPARAKTPPPGGYTGKTAKLPDDAKIAEWIATHPGGNLALRMPGDVLGIDVDDYEYQYHAQDPDTRQKLHHPDGRPLMLTGVKHGATVLAALEAELGPLPATRRSSSRGDGPSGIRFYRVPSGLLWGDFGLHLEGIWWGHRYAVVWPSVNPDSGLRYLWINDTDDDPEWGAPPPKIVDLPELPESWVARFGRAQDTAKALEPLPDRRPAPAVDRGGRRAFTREQAARYVETEGLEPLRAAAHGNINNKINDAATVLSHFVPHFWSPQAAQALIWDAARSAGYDHPMSATNTIGSGLATVSWVAELVSVPVPPPGGARTRPRDSEDDPWPTEAPEDAIPPEATGFWDARPALAYVRDYATERETNPWAVLGVTLGRVIAATEPNIKLPPTRAVPASLNYFVALVGPSGSGKTVSAKVARQMLDIRHGSDPIEVYEAPLGSGEGLAHVYMKPAPKPVRRRAKDDDDSVVIGIGQDGPVGEPVQYRTRALIKALEIDALDAINQRRGSTLSSQLRTAWDADQLGYFYANSDKRMMVPEHSYRMCLLLGVQPGRAEALMSEVDGGLPQRFLWVPTDNPDLPDFEDGDEDQPLPDSSSVLWTPPAYQAREVLMGQDPVVVRDVKRNGRKLAKGQGDALDGHAMLNRLKVAAGLALLCGDTPAAQCHISAEDWELSGVLMAVSDRTRAGVQRHLADVARVANEKKAYADARRTVVMTEHVEDVGMKKALKWARGKIGPDWITERDLMQGGRRVRDHLKDALAEMVAAGELEVGEYTAGNNAARHYRRLNTN